MIRRSLKNETNPMEPIDLNKITKRKLENGIWLKELREDKKMTRQELAQKIGVKYNTIASYESGHREIPENRKKQIEKILLNIYDNNDRENVFSEDYRLIEKLKRYNFSLPQFQYMKSYFICYFGKLANINPNIKEYDEADMDIRDTPIDIAKSVNLNKIITDIKEISKLDTEASKKFYFNYWYNFFVEIRPIDVISQYKIPCYNSSDFNYMDISDNVPIDYIYLPQDLYNDSYDYIAIKISQEFEEECTRYYAGDVVIVRLCDSFNDLDDVFMVLNDILCIKVLEKTTHTIDVYSDRLSSHLECEANNENSKIIGTIVYVYIRYYLDNAEKKDGLYNKRKYFLK